jgi:hypothetical protein
MGRERKFFLMQFPKGIFFFVLCSGVALAWSSLTLAQDAISGNLRQQLQPVKPTPIPGPNTQKSQPSLEISTETPSQTPAPVAEQTSAAEKLAMPAATAEKRLRPERRATSSPQPKMAKSPVVRQMSMADAKTIAVSAPLPRYPQRFSRFGMTPFHQPLRAGSGLCVMTVDTATGKVTSAVMEQSTGNAIFDAVTTNTFLKWRFKPGAVSQVRVPITYE